MANGVSSWLLLPLLPAMYLPPGACMCHLCGVSFSPPSPYMLFTSCRLTVAPFALCLHYVLLWAPSACTTFLFEKKKQEGWEGGWAGQTVGSGGQRWAGVLCFV